MKRQLMDKLLAWKDSPYRKPLLLRGVRQSGKTWLMKELGKLHFGTVAYFNFEENPAYRQFFEASLDVGRIIDNLALVSGQRIAPQETLLILDEIQDCPQALTSLKYFQENLPALHVICAGSLLGVTLAKPSSFPVGKVDFLDVPPMTFSEFLMACGDDHLYTYMQGISRIEMIPDAFFQPLEEKLKTYFITGGMPESVLMWARERDPVRVQTVLSNILASYERDFGKHPNAGDYPKISMIWRAIPSQLARENKKFLYQAVKEGARAREYENALQWLCDAGLTNIIHRISKPGLPLSAYDEHSAFKLYMVDTGLLRQMSYLAPSAVAEGDRLFVEFKGSLSENYVLQAISAQFDTSPRYWATDNPRYEVDFVLQRENDIIPIEVKAGTNTKSLSLRKYKDLYPQQTPLRLRLSLANLRLDGDLLNIPLFLADRMDALIHVAFEELQA